MFATVLRSTEPDFDENLQAWLDARTPGATDSEVRERVARILEDVRARGDEALIEWTEKLDKHHLEVGQLELEPERVWAAVEQADPDVVLALEEAHERIEAYHGALVPEDRFPLGEDGPAHQRVVPVRRAGVYVPGGRASYPSSVLMNVIPARVAGVEEVIMVVPAPGGHVAEAVLAAAAIAGVDRVFPVGGAQAIGALAFGTASVPRVDVIVGPGNRYVAEAKRQVFGRVGIDMIAGPSEVLVVVDDVMHAELAAADLLAQAEHDPAAVPMIMVPDNAVLVAVGDALERQVADLPRRSVCEKALSEQGLALVVDDPEACIDICDRIAPEHLELLAENAEQLATQVRYAGAVFAGRWTPEALGDYAAGPDHVLPTAGTARFASPLGPEDFMRRMSVLSFDRDSSRELLATVTTLARAEGLEAHARSAELRFALEGPEES